MLQVEGVLETLVSGLGFQFFWLQLEEWLPALLA